VEFGTGAVSFAARVASAGSGGNIELYLDSMTSSAIGSCAVKGTGGAQTWTTVSTGAIAGATGVHDLFLKFTGGSGDLFNVNWWQFSPKDPLDAGMTEAGASSSTSGSAIGSTTATASESSNASGATGSRSSGTLSGSASTASRSGTGSSTAGSGNGSSGQTSGSGSATHDGANSGAGCSCRSAPGTAPGVAMLAALPVFAALRRRARRTSRSGGGPRPSSGRRSARLDGGDS
jgi:arabinoxylan arabinofuranohydrolase